MFKSVCCCDFFQVSACDFLHSQRNWRAWNVVHGSYFDSTEWSPIQSADRCWCNALQEWDESWGGPVDSQPLSLHTGEPQFFPIICNDLCAYSLAYNIYRFYILSSNFHILLDCDSLGRVSSLIHSESGLNMHWKGRKHKHKIGVWPLKIWKWVFWCLLNFLNVEVFRLDSSDVPVFFLWRYFTYFQELIFTVDLFGRIHGIEEFHV